jgi:uncharacterized protein
MMNHRWSGLTSVVSGLLVLVLLFLTPMDASAGDRVFAWEVRSETATITMFGSIHLGRADFYPLPQAVEDAFEKAPVVAVEVDVLDPAAALEIMQQTMQWGMLKDGKTLDDLLSPELKEKSLVALGDKKGMWTVLRKYTPGLLAMTISLQAFQDLGFEESLGVEKHFLDAARGNKEIRNLETIEQQMSLIFGLEGDLQFVFLESTLDQLDEMEALIGDLVVAWKAGDGPGLDKIMTSQVGEDDAMQEFYAMLLDDRNVGMADKIDGWLQEDQDIFVLVGAGHFPGEMGVVKLLENKGWDVRQLEE